MQSYSMAFSILSMKLADLVLIYLPPHGETAPSRPRAPPLSRFLDHTQITTPARIALGE
jgi:hypothetical protein